jgi:hypothetical protein
VAVYGSESFGEPALQKQKEILPLDDISPETFVDVSEDGILWHWDAEYLRMLREKALTREQQLELHTYSSKCREAAHAMRLPLIEAAVKAKQHIYTEWTPVDFEQDTESILPPFKKLFVDEADMFSDYDIKFVLNIILIRDAVSESAEKTAFNIVRQRVLRLQYNYIRYAVAAIHKKIGKTRRFFIQRHCLLKNPSKYVDVTEEVVDLAATITAEQAMLRTVEDAFPLNDKQVDAKIHEWGIFPKESGTIPCGAYKLA